MRWDNLFDDLESQLEQGLSAEEVDLQAEEERLRLGRLSLRDRIMAVHEAESQAAGPGLRMSLHGGRIVVLRPVAFGKDWLSADLLDGSDRRSQCILPLHAIDTLILTRQQVDHSLRAPQESERGLASRLGLAFVLRDLCRRRRAVSVELPHGELHGTIDRVGRDHFDLAVHEAGTARRDTAVSSYRVIPLNQLLLLLL